MSFEKLIIVQSKISKYSQVVRSMQLSFSTIFDHRNSIDHFLFSFLNIIGANAQSRLNFLAGRITAHIILQRIIVSHVPCIISSQKEGHRDICSSSNIIDIIGLTNQDTILVTCGTIFQGTLRTGRYACKRKKRKALWRNFIQPANGGVKRTGYVSGVGVVS